jgi:hypothetical protein
VAAGAAVVVTAVAGAAVVAVVAFVAVVIVAGLCVGLPWTERRLQHHPAGPQPEQSYYLPPPR